MVADVTGSAWEVSDQSQERFAVLDNLVDTLVAHVRSVSDRSQRLAILVGLADGAFQLQSRMISCHRGSAVVEGGGGDFFQGHLADLPDLEVTERAARFVAGSAEVEGAVLHAGGVEDLAERRPVSVMVVPELVEARGQVCVADLAGVVGGGSHV